MQIIIKRTDNKYVFIKDEKILFWGTPSNKIFGFTKQLYNQENKLVTEAALKFRLPFKIFFKIRFLNTPQNNITLRFSNIFKPKFVCEYDSDLYEIIPHKGRVLKTWFKLLLKNKLIKPRFRNRKKVIIFEHKF
ncbi:MAG TPA: hypothetical protein PKW49_11810, partial [Paludibacteraceae bacterium]|nr:hypothetical protein [Paludibacteraceae bacterium]HOU69239.1 hypothetical protein [Paludibacteraceae bacterium]HQJ90599.1 hypothetical protein [Paludibacteraceae bacterium]